MYEANNTPMFTCIMDVDCKFTRNRCVVTFLIATAYECSQRGVAWLFLITAYAIKSHRVVASLKSSGTRICKPFVEAATRHSRRLSRVISGTIPREPLTTIFAMTCLRSFSILAYYVFKIMHIFL